MFIKICDEKTIEVFGIAVSDEYKENNIEEVLISEGLYKVFTDSPSIDNTIFFIDDIETSLLKIVEKLGFKYFSSYCCYEVLL